MNRMKIAFAAAGLTLATAAFGQAPAAPTGPAAEVAAAYNRLKPNILKAADKMPADSYSYKPTPEIRTFARVVNHVTEAQFHTCGALLGTTFPDSSVPPETADKAAVITALKASFDACDKAFAGLNDGALSESVSMGPVKRSRNTVAWGTVSHDNEQYATLALYLRLKGLVPPTSEK